MKIFLVTATALGLCMQLSIVFAASVCKTATITATTPTSSFVDNGDGTITHMKTGLMWKQCREMVTTVKTKCDTFSAPGSFFPNWVTALNLANASTFAGYSDWRLPNIKELMSIVEKQCHSPAINQSIFPEVGGGFFWSSTPTKTFSFVAIAASAKMVDFGAGVNASESTSSIGGIRLVRGGR